MTPPTEEEPFAIGQAIKTEYGATGEIKQATQDSTDPVHWAYLIKWATGTSGWWGGGKVRGWVDL